MKLQTAIFTIVHNYFQSYRGHGICDVIAAHGKQEASQEMNNTQTNIYTARELAAIIARRAAFYILCDSDLSWWCYHHSNL